MASYTQGVPPLTDPAASNYLLQRTQLTAAAYPNGGAIIKLTVYRYNGTVWVRQ